MCCVCWPKKKKKKKRCGISYEFKEEKEISKTKLLTGRNALEQLQLIVYFNKQRKSLVLSQCCFSLWCWAWVALHWQMSTMPRTDKTQTSRQTELKEVKLNLKRRICFPLWFSLTALVSFSLKKDAAIVFKPCLYSRRSHSFPTLWI